MDIIKSRDGEKYEKYESLLLLRDKLKNECKSLKISYMKEFGKEIRNVFEEKLKCIQKKKAITFCQMAINKGKTVSAEELRQYLEKQTAEYKKQLKEIIADNNRSKNAKEIPQMAAAKAKKLYRKIAKKIHPDINPLTQKNDLLMQFWDATCFAYEHSDVEELEELDSITDVALKQLGQTDTVFEIPDIEKKTEKLEKEIEKITGSEPYIYKNLLRNPARVSTKHKELKDEFEKYKKYAEELEEKLNEILEKSGVSFTWKII